MRRFGCILVLISAPLLTRAHEHWIDLDAFYPAPSQQVGMRLCSGHHFPKSTVVLKDKVVSPVTWRRPGGQSTPIDTRAGEGQRVGTLTPVEAGAHLLHVTLKRPRAPEPSYEGKAIIVVERETDVDAYAVGHGLELVPQQRLSGVVPGDVLPVALFLDGQRVAGTLSASRAGGKTSLLSTGVDRPARLKLAGAGRYLVTASREGRGCSLVFMIRNETGRTRGP
jgi:hypothetical protein